MKRKIVLILIVGLIGIQMSCSNDSDSEAESNESTKKEESLVETINGIKYEWYPGKKQLKFKGGVDANGFRDGKWEYFSEKGKVLSMTEYSHSKKNGFQIAMYPSGRIHFRGEWRNDEKVGQWTTYDTLGRIVNDQDLGDKQ